MNNVFYFISIIFVWHELYYITNYFKLKNQIINKNFTGACFSDVLFHILGLLMYIYIFYGLFLNFNYFIFLLILKIVNYFIFYINKKIYILYDSLISPLINSVLFLYLFIKNLYS